MAEETERPEAQAADPEEVATPRRRGWVSLYAVAFALLLGAGLAIAASSLGSLRSVGLLRASAGLSIAAIVVALLAMILPRRP